MMPMNEPHFNKLSPAELERLAIAAEECAESIQIIGKIVRHGYDSTHPDNEDGPDNRDMLQEELAHVMTAIGLMIEGGDIDREEMIAESAQKVIRMQSFCHHQDPEIFDTHGIGIPEEMTNTQREMERAKLGHSALRIQLARIARKDPASEIELREMLSAALIADAHPRERDAIALEIRVSELSCALRDCLSTFREDDKTTVITGDRQEMWRHVLDTHGDAAP